jgi:L-Ala-D/L-Glu epimerase
MIIESLEASVLQIPFKVAFAHASATRMATEAIWVVARSRDGQTGFGEGCPRQYVTAESLAGAQAFVVKHSSEWRASICDLASLSCWADAHAADIERHPSAWAAVELALLDLIGQTEGRPLEALLGLPQIAGSFRYTAVLGDASPQAFGQQLSAYQQLGFRDFKIKLAGDLTRDRTKVGALLAAGIHSRAVRADANNLWSSADAAVAYLHALKFPFWAVEEPLRVGDYSGMRRVSTALDTRIVLDESMLRAAQLDTVQEDAGRWILNLRVSKLGGLLRSRAFARVARRLGFALIVGAHVGETSVLARAALSLANAFPDCILAHEGAFGTHLLVRDVVESSLVFGRGGLLDAAALGVGLAPGLGLAIYPRCGGQCGRFQVASAR